MWKSFFLAVGISICILGGECMLIDKAVLAAGVKAPASNQEGTLTSGSRDYTPPDWMPWSLLSLGSVVILYSFTIPRRVAGS